MIVSIYVPGEPIAQPRHRITGGRAYIPSKHPIHNWKRKVGLTAALRKSDDWPIPADVPVRLTMIFYFTRSNTLRKRAEKEGRVFYHHTAKPDVDNCAKAVMDSIEHIVYHSDAQVDGIIAHKKYSDAEPGLDLEIEWGEE